jgi:hypothetical protein
MNSSELIRAYLVSFLYWLSFPAGSLVLLMIHRLTEGAWGDACLMNLKASAKTIGPFGILFVPILLGLRQIYPWMSIRLHGGNQIYLSAGFFSARAVFYFVGWTFLAFMMARKDGTKALALAAGGLVFFTLSSSFASFDWQMSLEPEWHSTLYGLIFGIGQVLQAWAIAVFILARSARFGGLPEKTQRDLANLLLALVMVWAYLSFMQYLIIWSGNLPDEVSWVASRTRGKWQVLAISLIALQFALPFSLLLFRSVKSRGHWVSIVCAFVLFFRLVEHYWLIMPAFNPASFHFNLWVLPTFSGLGGIWLLMFRYFLRKDARYV